MSAEPQNPPPEPPAEQGEYGPGGYLPPRAAQRARKIVLREQMGVHWPIAAVVAGVLIVLVILPLVLADSGPPGPPFADAGPLAEVDPRSDALLRVDGTDVLVVRGGGVLRAFADPPAGARFCAASRRIEAPGGAVWSLQGRRVGGEEPSLRPVRAVAYESRLYLDVHTDEPLPAPGAGAVAPECTE